MDLMAEGAKEKGCGLDRPWVEACEVHPFELAVSGFSGSGKTTLLERLVPALAPLRIGFLKSDAHRVAMDREGKDTFRLSAAGCAEVGIRSRELSAHVVRGEGELREWKTRLVECDAVLLEGFRDTRIPKLLVLDEAGEAWRDLGAGRYSAVEALVHADAAPDTMLPAFHRDDIQGMAEFVKSLWERRIPRVRGLVLSGGESRRMGVDKASLTYHGTSQAAWLCGLLADMELDPLVSRAPGQNLPEGVDPARIVPDRFLGYGPLGGILTAMETDPSAAWLVVGCDLPFVDRAVLERLLAARDPFRDATVHLDSDGRFPEPMLSLWEPKSRLRAFQFLAMGYRCPRKVLINSRANLLPSPPGQILFNANTPADRDAALLDISRSPA
jgi:molybdenum cofactor guanylyltransferase